VLGPGAKSWGESTSTVVLPGELSTTWIVSTLAVVGALVPVAGGAHADVEDAGGTRAGDGGPRGGRGQRRDRKGRARESRGDQRP
jgi:hypothetical protein